ncbi:MAG: SMC-Scp complex subunit ScpB [Bacteroidetes bacterium]|nr:SMC-Scp complex subunit ScpB [Bacteroidota bacterium]
MSEDHIENTTGNIQGLGSTRLESAVEGLIFASDKAVSAAILAQTFAEATGEDAPSSSEIESVINRLNVHYKRTDRAFRIEKWGSGYRFATITSVAPFIKALFVTDRQRKLSRTLMESLAILSYKQPASRAELEFIRGVDCDYALRKLLEYGLIDVVGRSESVGRPLLYGTTQRFLELFGLPSIADLPNLRELESILDDPAFQKEKARMLMTSTAQLPLNVDGTIGTEGPLGEELEIDEES